MSILNSVIKIFVGDKQQKDLKILRPIVEKVSAFETSLSSISNDELRGKTIEFKQRISEGVKVFNDKITALEKEAKEVGIERQQEIFSEIDTLKNDSYDVSESILNELMPEAFAVVKETATRFVNNDEVQVTATPFDRELSSTREHIVLEGDKAFWQNSWDAAGKPVTWDMIHYNVQLIGGSVLYQKEWL